MVVGLIIESTTMQGIEKQPETDTYKALCLALVNKYYGN